MGGKTSFEILSNDKRAKKVYGRKCMVFYHATSMTLSYGVTHKGVPRIAGSIVEYIDMPRRVGRALLLNAERKSVNLCLEFVYMHIGVWCGRRSAAATGKTERKKGERPMEVREEGGQRDENATRRVREMEVSRRDSIKRFSTFSRARARARARGSRKRVAIRN